jgi:hypothetical protein
VLLTHLIDSMRDTDGKILVPGFYDDVRPLTEIEKQTLAQTPAADKQLKQELAQNARRRRATFGRADSEAGSQCSWRSGWTRGIASRKRHQHGGESREQRRYAAAIPVSYVFPGQTFSRHHLYHRPIDSLRYFWRN